MIAQQQPQQQHAYTHADVCTVVDSFLITCKGIGKYELGLPAGEVVVVYDAGGSWVCLQVKLWVCIMQEVAWFTYR